MSEEDRREGVRYITEMTVALRSTKGEVLDDRATAHDISTKGFKVETQTELVKDSRIAFALDLPAGRRVGGLGQVVWTKRETFATWAGIKTVKMSWSDRRLLSSVLAPSSTEWSRIFDVGTKAAVVVVIAIAAQNLVFHTPTGLGSMGRLIPKYAAILIMGWALLGLVRR